MEAVRTVKILLALRKDEILPTLRAYTDAFNFASKHAFQKRIKKNFALHKETYDDIRRQFLLPAQLAVSVIAKSAEGVSSVLAKKDKYPSCPQSALQSIRYDHRSYSFLKGQNSISLLTIEGRKVVPLLIPKHYEEFFSSWERGSAELILKKEKVFLHITFTKQVEDAPRSEASSKVLGIDRGIRNIAVLSNNKFFGGKFLLRTIRRFQRLRSSLQKKGTRSAKRHLALLSGREKRFRADLNHQISKAIIESLAPGDIIVLEDLSGISKNRNSGRALRAAIGRWSYFQLEQFLRYKAEFKGIHLVKVDAAYTSQECSCCGFVCRENRKGNSFRCKRCAFALNADLNASRVVRLRYVWGYTPQTSADVNQPNDIVGNNADDINASTPEGTKKPSGAERFRPATLDASSCL